MASSFLPLDIYINSTNILVSHTEGDDAKLSVDKSGIIILNFVSRRKDPDTRISHKGPCQLNCKNVRGFTWIISECPEPGTDFGIRREF